MSNRSFDDVLRYIDESFKRDVEEFRALVRQPSVSAQNVGVKRCAEILRDMMIKAGIDAKVTLLDKGNPVVFGELESKSSQKTLLIYGHYDVQPPEPLEEWVVDPFSAELREDKIMGRGSSDSKNNLFAQIKAAEAFLKTIDKVPVNLKFIFEGEEEVGSPNLPSFIHEYRDQLVADGTVVFDGGLDISGKPVIDLGVKGIAYIELRVRCATKDVHSSRAPIVPNPVWRLMWALNTMKDESETITIDGFYDKVRPPTQEELELMRRIPFNEESTLKDLGLKEFLNGVTGHELLRRLLFEPTCNICGIMSGYTGPGSKTVLPNEVFAKMDFRLVPDLDPQYVIEKVKRHLEKRGFGDIQVADLHGYPPARTSIETEIAQVTIRAAEATYEMKPIIYPTIPASTPMYLFTRDLGVPAVGTGCGDPFGNAHAPNENIAIDRLRDGIKYAAAIMYGFAISCI